MSTAKAPISLVFGMCQKNMGCSSHLSTYVVGPTVFVADRDVHIRSRA
jgi:hypothetical protein